MNTPTPTNLRVTRHFGTSAERVFDSFFDSKLVGKWMFATPTGQMVRIEIDARVGGEFVFTDRRDGEDIDHTGRYLEIERPHRIVFTFKVPKYSQLDSRVTIDIVATKTGCELTLTQEQILPEYVERSKGGWTMILDNWAKALGV